jgi:arginyl-tRNA synthetase
MRLSLHLDELARRALDKAHGSNPPALVRPADPARADYQVNGVMALAKQLGRPPRELAQPVADLLAESQEIESAEVAGPGFINLRLSLPWLGRALAEMAADRERDGVPRVERPQRIVVDYSAPNIAKELHVGHIRSTIIGNALYRIHGFLGHEVIGDNHVGDWGTQYGRLIVGMRAFGSEAALAADPITELERVYKLATARAKDDPEFAEQARAELAKLQRGEPDNVAMWKHMAAATRVTLESAYARLGVKFDLWRGESAYEEMLPGIVQALLDRGIAREDQGAICVFFEDDPALAKIETPYIVRKSDGAFLYSTTDIATLLYRKTELRTERTLYVVDQRQKLHFQMLFAIARKLGLEMELEHIGFGSVLGKDGKPLQTRAGETIKLSALLDEAEERAARLISTEGLEIDAAEAGALARTVGIGAVKYADLSQNRASDYRFDWDKLISLKGNSGPYLQYAHARIRAIFRKGDIDPTRFSPPGALVLEHEAEIALGKQLLRFPDVVFEAAAGHLPHLICEHLYALARQFSSFYEQCSVLKAEPQSLPTRLSLCALTARQLERGLGLCGIDAPERM